MLTSHRSLWAAASLAAASLLGLTLVPRSDKPPPPSTEAAAVTPVLPAGIDPVAIQAHAWARAEPHLAEAERQASAALAAHLASIHAFLDERKAGSKAFAERLVGLRGKWELVKSEIGHASGYSAFLNEAFNQHVFTAEELEQAVQTAVRGFLAELESIDEQLLVRLRADLADDALPIAAAVPALRSEQLFRARYQELSARVAHDLRTDLRVIAGRELFLWHASNIATDLTLKVGAALAARLGISTTILGSGAASTWGTLGVGLVVSIVLDAVVCRLIKAAGYDAEAQVARRVEETLSDLGRTITDGDPQARATLTKLQAMQQGDPDPEIRAACTEAIRSIEAGTQLYGLRRDLTKLSAARASWRQETLRRLIHDREVTP